MASFSTKFLVLSVLVSIAYFTNTALGSPTFTDLENLTPSQRASLQKLKESVSSVVPHDYMKQDIYLVNWLIAHGFSARKAEQSLREALKWRTTHNVDSWSDPKSFTEFEKDFPSFLDGVDREGRPIIESYFGDWNVRQMALQGKIKQLTLYSLRGLERASKRIVELQSQGKNVTQANLLLNMDGFNVINQACPTCLPLYLGFVSQYEKYWPNILHRSLLINTPDTFEIILNLIKPLMSPATRAGFKVFSSNRAEWKPFLDNIIDPSEISDWFDGKKSSSRAQN